MSEEYELSKILAQNLRRRNFAQYNDKSFLNENFLALKYAEIFGIEPNNNWIEAFKIITEGQGGEIRKINSLISSSLLSLLTFHKLFRNNNPGLCLEVKLPDNEKTVKFDQCFFEVRNKVISLPSCVDVALYSTESNILLFLESKFTEIFSTCEKALYGKGYIDLYTNKHLIDTLSSRLKIGRNKSKGKEMLSLEVNGNGKHYIEGIKQSVSHLIGLVKGPAKSGQGYYPEEYYADYRKLYNNARELYYGTILFEPSGLKEGNGPFKDYCDLYCDTIGMHGEEIIAGIREWIKARNKNCDKAKSIRVLNIPLTYQSLFKGENSSLLTSEIRSFYSL
ncbi:MAG: hypothetical protein HDS89_08565 [Bacteroidales bacterium]|nr:hypothetical protein [Bacteroidales bacterium]